MMPLIAFIIFTFDARSLDYFMLPADYADAI